MITHEPTADFPTDPKQIAEFLLTKNEFLLSELETIVRFDPDGSAIASLTDMGLLDDKGKATERGRAVVREARKLR